MAYLRLILDPFGSGTSATLTGPIYDSHCHFLTLDVVYKELRCIVEDDYPWLIWGSILIALKYPRLIAVGTGAVVAAYEFVNSILEKIKNENQRRLDAKKTGDAGTEQDAANEAKKAWDEMMISIQRKDDGVQQAFEAVKEDIYNRVKKFFEEGVLAEFSSSEVDLYNKMKKSYKDTKFTTEERQLKITPLIMDFRYMFHDLVDSTTTSVPYGPEMSPGYQAEINVMENEIKPKGDAYPFLAVDPRRPGIENLVRQKVNRNSGPFHGVKLYPKLGFAPSCKGLQPILEYCCENAIPVISHATPEGFPPGNTPGFADKNGLGHPEQWRKAFVDNPKIQNLYLDLAHFPSQIDSFWHTACAKLMHDYKNVYTDFSCATGTYSLENGLLELMSENGTLFKLRDKVLFGTDFDVISAATMSSFPGKPLDWYLNRYLSVFGGQLELRNKMENENPKRFFRFDA